MSYIEIDNLSYKYPLSESYALKNINLKVDRGDFVLIFGRSGQGKTSLLKQFKGNILLSGKREGSIYIGGREIKDLKEEESIREISYIGQNPSEQIVTDKVWHELAFGLENLGVDRDLMRTRVSEMGSFFNMEDIFDKNTQDLSGGQKQILNLSSSLVLRQDLLILDEPTSSLDPIRSQEFFDILKKLNEELGITIIMTEHKLNRAISLCNRAYLMEGGELFEFYFDNLRNIPMDERTLSLLPKFTRLKLDLNEGGKLGKTIRDGRNILREFAGKYGIEKREEVKENNHIENPREVLMEVRNIYFSYGKDQGYVLKDLSLDIYKGEVLSIIGANGSGKTSLLNVLTRILKLRKGSIKYRGESLKSMRDKDLYGSINLLSQNVEDVFSYDRVIEELREMTDDEDRIGEVIGDFELDKLLNSHPFDLSEGEKERLGLSKIFLNDNEFIILDEPTRAMDSYFKEKFICLLEKYKKGKTLLIVSHDLDFLSRISDRIGFLFDGKIQSIGDVEKILGENIFYTSETHKISRNILGNFLIYEDLLEYIRGYLNE